MADTKYGKFVLGSILKLAVFIMLCAGAYIASRFLGSPADKLLPSVMAVIFTFIFLAAVEGGKRSFFSKGYVLENIVPGAVYAIVIYGLSFFVLFVLGETHITGITSGFDLTEIFLQIVKFWLFAGIAVYGYFFHILQKDFGSITAVLLSALLFMIFAVSQTAGLSSYFDGISSEEVIIAIDFFLIGIIAGLLIVRCGDMRSAASFLFFYGLCTATAEGIGGAQPILEVSTHGIGIGIVSTVVMVGAVISVITAIKKDNS